MNEDFSRKWWIAGLFAVVLTALAVGTTAYQMGVSRGVALQPPAASAPPAAGAPQTAPDGYVYRYRPYGPWRGFGVFGGLIGLLWTIVIFRLIFGAMFGWGCFGWRRRYWGRGWNDPYYGPGGFDDWHRQAHDRMRGEGAPAPPASNV